MTQANKIKKEGRVELIKNWDFTIKIKNNVI